MVRRRCLRQCSRSTLLYSFILLLTLSVIYTLILQKGRPEPPCCVKGNRVRKKYFSGVNLSRKNSAVEEIQFVVKSNKCLNVIKDRRNPWLLVGVLSHAYKFSSRQAIRQTWGSILNIWSSGPVCMIFIVAQTNKKLEIKLKTEIKMYKDIVMINKEETYRNLVYKSIALLKWADEQIRHFEFVLKIDDDVFLNVPSFYQKLRLYSSQSQFIMGQLLTQTIPIRNEFSRLFINKTEYRGDVLPDYMNGPSYVISGDLVHSLISEVPNCPLVFVEDVYITGILASCVEDISYIGCCGFVAKNIIHKVPFSITSIHDLYAHEIVSLWNASVLSFNGVIMGDS